MSRHQVMIIAQPSATAFLAALTRRESDDAKGMGSRSYRGAKASDDFSGQLATKAPALSHWGYRRAMKRTGQERN